LLLRRLVEGRNRQLLQRTGGRMQVAMREMQIDGGVFQVRMAEKQLNGSQIGPGFQVVGSKTVTQRVRSDFFSDAGTNGGLFADVPEISQAKVHKRTSV